VNLCEGDKPFKNLDIPVVGNITDELGKVFWFTLNKEFISHVNGELMLKYAGAVPGLWTVVCIIDQVPTDNQPPSNQLDEFLGNFLEMRNQLFDVAYMISPLILYRNLELPMFPNFVEEIRP
jgi:hypothetical protein